MQSDFQKKITDDIITKSKVFFVVDIEEMFATLWDNQMPLNPKKMCVWCNEVNVWVSWSMKGELTQILINFKYNYFQTSYFKWCTEAEESFLQLYK